MLPGMYIGAGMAQVIDDLEYRSHNYYDTTVNPSIPAGIQAGDLLIAMGMTAVTKTPVTPSGWTAIANDSLSGTTNSVCKVADGTETGEVEMFQFATPVRSLCIAFKGGLISLGSIVDAEAEQTGGVPTAQVKNASTLGTLPFIVVGGYMSSGTIDPRGWFGTTEDGEQGDLEAYIKWNFYGVAGTPVDITVGMDDEGTSNGLWSAIIEVVF